MSVERKRPLGEETKLPEGGRLSVEDERVRDIRDSLWAAKARLEEAARFVMFPEVRQRLRGAQADLARALAYIGSGSDPFAN